MNQERMQVAVSTTSLSDLPTQGGGGFPGGMQGGGMQGGQSNMEYKTLDLHPSPYGHNAPGVSPYATPQGGGFPQGVEDIQHRLPSRDIPPNANGYMHDETIQQNYIPRHNTNSDYVRESEDGSKGYRRDRRQKNEASDLFTMVKWPVLMAMLFFLFNTSVINYVMYKQLSALDIYNSDGNLNVYGILIKSLLFGLAVAAAERGGTYALSL